MSNINLKAVSSDQLLSNQQSIATPISKSRWLRSISNSDCHSKAEITRTVEDPPMDTCPMDTATAPASSSKPLAAHSCQRCAARKIKCDKQQPCGACVKSNAECEHRLLPRPKRRKRQDRNEVLVRRLEQYERLLHQKVAGSEVPPKDPEDLSSSRSSYRSDSTVKDVKNSPLSRPSGLSVTHPMSALPQDQVLVRDENRSKYLDKSVNCQALLVQC